MAERKPEGPEAGDLVNATAETVTDYGANAKLAEFRNRGLLYVLEKLYVMSASKYNGEVAAENSMQAKGVLQKTSQNFVTAVSKEGGQGSFRREK
ncbi:MAG: hypothetical protein ABSF65_03730 [Candidatus Bathyarchaeia archaeon]|jgi:translation initiation factor 2 alpha subunit (eIF-2alpha)